MKNELSFPICCAVSGKVFDDGNLDFANVEVEQPYSTTYMYEHMAPPGKDDHTTFQPTKPDSNEDDVDEYVEMNSTLKRNALLPTLQMPTISENDNPLQLHQENIYEYMAIARN